MFPLALLRPLGVKRRNTVNMRVGTIKHQRTVMHRRKGRHKLKRRQITVTFPARRHNRDYRVHHVHIGLVAILGRYIELRIPFMQLFQHRTVTGSHIAAAAGGVFVLLIVTEFHRGTAYHIHIDTVKSAGGNFADLIYQPGVKLFRFAAHVGHLMLHKGVKRCADLFALLILDHPFRTALIPVLVFHVPQKTIGVDLGENMVVAQTAQRIGKRLNPFPRRIKIRIMRVVRMLMIPVPVQRHRHTGILLQLFRRRNNPARMVTVPQPDGYVTQQILLARKTFAFQWQKFFVEHCRFVPVPLEGGEQNLIRLHLGRFAIQRHRRNYIQKQFPILAVTIEISRFRES